MASAERAVLQTVFRLALMRQVTVAPVHRDAQMATARARVLLAPAKARAPQIRVAQASLAALMEFAERRARRHALVQVRMLLDRVAGGTLDAAMDIAERAARLRASVVGPTRLEIAAQALLAVLMATVERVVPLNPLIVVQMREETAAQDFNAALTDTARFRAQFRVFR